MQKAFRINELSVLMTESSFLVIKNLDATAMMRRNNNSISSFVLFFIYIIRLTNHYVANLRTQFRAYLFTVLQISTSRAM